MRRIFCLIISYFIFVDAYGQAKDDSAKVYLDTVEVRYGVLGITYRQEGEVLKNSELRSILAKDSVATKKLRQGLTLRACAQGMALAGIGCIFLSVGPALASGNSTTSGFQLGVAGLGLVLGSMAIMRQSRAVRTRAVNMYNSGRAKLTQAKAPLEYHLAFGARSVGLLIKF